MNDRSQKAPLGSSARWRSLPSAVLGDMVNAEPLSGGAVNDIWRLTLANGTRLVLKGFARTPSDLFPVEAEGLLAPS